MEQDKKQRPGTHDNDIAPEFKGIIFRDGEAEIKTFEAFK